MLFPDEAQLIGYADYLLYFGEYMPSKRYLHDQSHTICMDDIGAGNQGAGSHPEIWVPECQPKANLVRQRPDL